MRGFLYLKAILSVYSSLLTEKERLKAASQLPRIDVQILLEEVRSTGELPRPDGAGHGPAVLCRPGPALIPVSQGDNQLLEK